MIQLIMLSGGLDSTYLLYRALKETNDKVWAHHIILKNLSENRWEAELKATKKIVEYCKNIRGFGYSESEWGFYFKKYIAWDADVVAFVASQIVPNISLRNEKVVLNTGRVQEDDKIATSIRQMEYSQAIWEASTKKYEKLVEKEIAKPIKHLSKKDLMKDMPQELIDMVWYCRHDYNNGVPCGQCKSCRDMQKANQELMNTRL